jgi:hypothetical protein
MQTRQRAAAYLCCRLLAGFIFLYCSKGAVENFFAYANLTSVKPLYKAFN